MPLDPSNFKLINVLDTCAVWNVLSSGVLYNAAIEAGCNFCITVFVHYECLLKPRKEIRNEDEELKSRLRKELDKDKIAVYNLEIEDLQEIAILEKRRNLGKGELSTIAFAKKINQAIMTDDKKARNLAEQVMERIFVQTTPHLFGWLFFSGYLLDYDRDKIINQHKDLNRPLEKFFNIMYERALEYRLMRKSVLDRNS